MYRTTGRHFRPSVNKGAPPAMSITPARPKLVLSNRHVEKPVANRVLPDKSTESAASSAEELSTAIEEINRSAARIVDRRQPALV
jgi:hypothetical protein